MIEAGMRRGYCPRLMTPAVVGWATLAAEGMGGENGSDIWLSPRGERALYGDCELADCCAHQRAELVLGDMPTIREEIGFR